MIEENNPTPIEQIVDNQSAVSRVIVHTSPLYDVLNGVSGIISGALRVIAKELKDLDSHENIILCTPESASYSKKCDLAEVRVSPDINVPTTHAKNLFSKYRGTAPDSKGGTWQLFHPKSHSIHFPIDCLKQVLKETEIDEFSLDVETFIHYLDLQIAKTENYEQSYFSSWEKAFSNLPEKCTIYLEGFSSLGVFTCANFPASSQNQKVVLRFHEPIPESLEKSRIGRKILHRVSQADTVLVCTDLYRESLSSQLQSCNLQIPNIVSHRLGIDFDLVKKTTLAIDQNNYTSLIPGFENLEQEQKLLLKDAVETRKSIPNRFYVGDGPDPIKGLYQVLLSIDDFLSSLQTSLEDSRALYRFYLTQYSRRNLSDIVTDPSGFNNSYRLKCFELRDALVKKFPGIVIASDAFRGPASVAVYAIMPFCNFLSGSLEDALHLMCQEAAYCNYLHSTGCTIVIGKNAGFSMQVKKDCGDDLAYFVDSSQPKSISDSIRTISELSLRQKYPSYRDLNEKLVERHILTRSDSLFNY